jgi:hypothetical protein
MPLRKLENQQLLACFLNRNRNSHGHIKPVGVVTCADKFFSEASFLCLISRPTK